jgi:hypothetical protein
VTLLDDFLSADAEPPVKCSRAGCHAAAAWNVNWRNPRIHAIDRVKIWLACDEHRDYLREYLAARDFPVVVTPLGETVELVPADPLPTGS